jgi:hypothetical protein
MDAGEREIVSIWEREHPGQDWRRHEDQVSALMEASVFDRRATHRQPRHVGALVKPARMNPSRKGMSITGSTTYAALQDRLQRDRARGAA